MGVLSLSVKSVSLFLARKAKCIVGNQVSLHKYVAEYQTTTLFDYIDTLFRYHVARLDLNQNRSTSIEVPSVMGG